jgi:hypothetical protein
LIKAQKRLKLLLNLIKLSGKLKKIGKKSFKSNQKVEKLLIELTIYLKFLMFLLQKHSNTLKLSLQNTKNSIVVPNSEN